MKQELRARTKQFALSVIAVVADRRPSKAADVIGSQLMKSGTSICASYREPSRAAFIHKISICEKEAAETEYWLELQGQANLATSSLVGWQREIRELLAIFVSSGRTAKSRE